MKNSTFSLLCLILTAAPHLARADVNNGDFESSAAGAADGWTYEMTEFLQVAKEANGNSYLKYVKGKPEYFDAKQTVNIPGGSETIMLRARMRLKGFVRNQDQRWKCPMIGIDFIKADGSRRKEKGIHLVSDSGDEWFYLYRMINVPRGAQQAELTLVNDASAGEVHFDDISISTANDKMLPLEVINTAGHFQARTEDETVIFGWRARVAGRVQLPESGGEFYLNLQGERRKTAFAETILELNPAWKKLKVSCRMKSEFLEVGFSPTHTVKLVLEFVDENEEKMDKWITPMQLKRDTPDWTEMNSEFTVPEGAAGLKITPTVQQCDGSGQFDDIKVEVLQ